MKNVINQMAHGITDTCGTRGTILITICVINATYAKCQTFNVEK